MNDAMQSLLSARYLLPGETEWRQVAERVGWGLFPENAAKAAKVQELVREGIFIPSSPVLMNAGTEYAMMCSCFVLPVYDSIAAIMQSLTDTMMIQKYGGGVGINFSHIRAEGTRVSTTRGIASGPVSFMGFWNEGMNVIRQGGKRQGAMMGVLNADHPDLDLFIHAKEYEGKLTNFNLSVGLLQDLTEEQVHTIAKAMWHNGEPGVLFLDNINKHNPYTEYISATNPCGEVPLPPYGACCLGSINVSKFVRHSTDGTPWVDFSALWETATQAAEILDRVLDKTWWPLPQIRDFEKRYRPIGVGVMGLTDALAMMNLPYGSREGLALTDLIMRSVRAGAEEWGDGKNATLLSVAPTGTIAMLADCSYSIEPYFSLSFVKHTQAGDFAQQVPVVDEVARMNDYSLTDEDLFIIRSTGSAQNTGMPPHAKEVLRTANDIGWEEHLAMQVVVQDHVDNAVSKTINLPTETTVEEVEKIVLTAHDAGLKGLTVYRNKSREQEVISCANGSCSI